MIIGSEVQIRRMMMPVRRRFLASATGLAVGAVVVPGEHRAQAAAPEAVVAPNRTASWETTSWSGSCSRMNNSPPRI